MVSVIERCCLTCVDAASDHYPRGVGMPIMKNLHRALPAWLVVTMMLIFAQTASAASINLAWDPPNPAPDLAGFKVLYGTQRDVYTTTVDVGNRTTFTVDNLASGQTYYFAVLAYNRAQSNSPLSNVVSGTPAPPPTSGGTTPPPPPTSGGTTPPPPPTSGGTTPPPPPTSGGTKPPPPATPVGTVTPARSNDLDGDTRRDIAVFRPSTGVWFLRFSSNDYSAIAPGMYQWGMAGDIPLSG